MGLKIHHQDCLSHVRGIKQASKFIARAGYRKVEGIERHANSYSGLSAASQRASKIIDLVFNRKSKELKSS